MLHTVVPYNNYISYVEGKNVIETKVISCFPDIMICENKLTQICSLN